MNEDRTLLIIWLIVGEILIMSMFLCDSYDVKTPNEDIAVIIDPCTGFQLYPIPKELYYITLFCWFAFLVYLIEKCFNYETT